MSNLDPLPRRQPPGLVQYRPGRQFAQYLKQMAQQFDLPLNECAKRLAILAATRFTIVHLPALDELAGHCKPGQTREAFAIACAHARQQIDANVDVGLAMLKTTGESATITTVDGIAALPLHVELQMIHNIIEETRHLREAEAEAEADAQAGQERR